MKFLLVLDNFNHVAVKKSTLSIYDSKETHESHFWVKGLMVIFIVF